MSLAFSTLPLLAITGHDLAEAIPVILSLIIIEGLLSVDNALAIAAMASRLPGRQKILALRLGIIGAYLFRGIALACASLIIANPWVKIVGALYLIHLMAVHFGQRNEDADEAPSTEGTTDENAAQGERAFASSNASAQGCNTAQTDTPTAEIKKQAAHVAKAGGRGLVATIVAIEFMDLSLSVDNVVAAVVMSPKIWVVCTGVFIGILALRLVAGYCIKLIERYPILEHTAFLLIGYVGMLLFFELGTDVDVHAFGKFVGIAIITGLSMLYSRSPGLTAVLRPLIWISGILMRAYTTVVNAVLTALMSPFRALVHH